jgi:hypothetical protein
MDINDYVREQVSLLRNGFSKSQIMDNVYRFVFRAYVPNMEISAAIKGCMKIYAEITRIAISEGIDGID